MGNEVACDLCERTAEPSMEAKEARDAATGRTASMFTAAAKEGVQGAFRIYKFSWDLSIWRFPGHQW